MPTAMAVSSLIAIGTSHGLVLVFGKLDCYDKVDTGMPTAMAVSSLIAIGTSHGLVLVFGKLYCYDKVDAGMPTAMAVSSLIAIGTSHGLVLVFGKLDCKHIFIPRRSRRDIVLAASVRPFSLSVLTFCPSVTISQYLLVRFDSFLVQMISTMGSRYLISFVKINPLTLELLPLL